MNSNRGEENTLTPEMLAFAHRMFNAARYGDSVLLQAVDAGLPVNMTNDEGLSPLNFLRLALISHQAIHC